MVHVDCFQFCYRLSAREVVIVTLVNGFVLGPLSFLTGFENLGGVALAVFVVDGVGGDASNRWESLLWVKFDVVHLEVPLWRWALYQPSSDSSCISDGLWKDPNIWNSKIIVARLSLWRSNLVDILPV